MTDTLPLERAHDDGCGCVRCQGFAPGNAVALKHGAYSRLKLAPRAEEIASDLREVVPVMSPADEATLGALSIVLSQLERSALVLVPAQTRELDAARGSGTLDAVDRDDLRRLSADARGWASVALRYLEALGLSPTARARLGLDLMRGEATRLTVTRLAAMAEDEAAS